MKKTMLYAMLTLFAGWFLADMAVAGNVSKRQIAQQKRIQQGVRSGSLTKAEARVLRTEQRKIKQAKKRFLADGVLSKKERRKLASLQKRADGHIKRLKHNRSVRSPHRVRRPQSGVGYRHIAAGQLLHHSV